MKFLRENAEYFEKKAREALEEKPRFVLYFAEQALQLYIKYIIARFIEDYPKTHNLRLLFTELSKIKKDALKFYEDFSDVLDLIEESYITARYLGKEYSEKSAKNAIQLIDEFKKRFRECLE